MYAFQTFENFMMQFPGGACPCIPPPPPSPLPTPSYLRKCLHKRGPWEACILADLWLGLRTVLPWPFLTWLMVGTSFLATAFIVSCGIGCVGAWYELKALGTNSAWAWLGAGASAWGAGEMNKTSAPFWPSHLKYGASSRKTNLFYWLL